MRVTGYGIDNDQLFLSRTQQTATGRFDQLSHPDGGGTALEYEVDTMDSSSGSPVIWNSIGYAIGIHTAPGCNDILLGNENHGTSFLHPPLFGAVGRYMPSGTYYVDATSPSAIQIGHVLWPFRSVSTALMAPTA